MNTRTLLLFCFSFLLVAPASVAQAPAASTHTVLVLPFENASKAPGLEWIGEAFPEVLGQRLASVPGLYVISREHRLYAFDRLGIPANIKPSRATLYRIAEQMDSDFVVLGSYDFDGQTFTSSAQVLDMKKLRLSPEVKSSGPLVDLIGVQTSLAWETLRSLGPQPAVSRDEFMRGAGSIRLDAFENYIRGIVATDRAEKVRRFREAVRLNPQYTMAILQLGRTHYNAREYDSAAAWLPRVPAADPAAGEAYFLLGLSYYYLGQFDKSENAFKVTASKVPLTEVLNDLGVVASRRGKREAIDYFQRAVQNDPNDPDYRYNLALSLWRAGNTAGASRTLKDSVARHPTDVEARQLLDAVNATTAGANTAGRTFLPRIKRNYDENSYRQLALEVQSVMAASLAKADPKTQSSFHAERGTQLLASGMISDAEKEFRTAVLRDPTNAEAHVGLARLRETQNDLAGARAEARTALQLQPSAEAYLVLARVDLKQNNTASAMQNIDQALWLEPSNTAALNLKHQLAERQAKPEPRS